MRTVQQAYLYKGSTCTLVIEGATASDTGLYLGAGTTGEARVTDVDGVDIAGQVWPAVLTYVPGTNGEFRAELSADLVVDYHQPVVIHFMLTAPNQKRYADRVRTRVTYPSG